MVIIVITIFLAEGVLMWILNYFVFLPPQAEGFLDSAFLILVVYPVLYFFLYRPMVLYITERRQAEEELKQAHEDLKKSHEELKTAQLYLVQLEKMDSVGRLAAGVAHEVKNPLSIIQMAVKHLLRCIAADDQRTKGVLEDIDAAAIRADTIIKGLLDFSAPSALTINSKSLNPIVEHSVSLIKHQLDKSHIHLITTLSDDLPPLELDANKIEQLFINLLMNAMQAMPRGGTLAVKTYAKQLTEIDCRSSRKIADRFRAGETVAVAEVEDTGVGIPEKNLSKIFDPFFTTKPPGQGTGLGLTIASKIVEMHGGNIDIQNRQEGGVRVTLMFKTKGDFRGFKASPSVGVKKDLGKQGRLS